MKKFLLILLTFSTLFSCKSQTENEIIKQDIKQIFNYIKNDNITELKKHLVTKKIFKEYLKEQIRLTSQDNYKLKIKKAYEKQSSKKLSKEELAKYINNLKKRFEVMLKDNNKLIEFFKAMGIQDNYNIEYLNMIKKKGQKSINWNNSKIIYYYLQRPIAGPNNVGVILFSDGNSNIFFVIRNNVLKVNDKFYYILSSVRSTSSKTPPNRKNTNGLDLFIDFTK